MYIQKRFFCWKKSSLFIRLFSKFYNPLSKYEMKEIANTRVQIFYSRQQRGINNIQICVQYEYTRYINNYEKLYIYLFSNNIFYEFANLCDWQPKKYLV